MKTVFAWLLACDTEDGRRRFCVLGEPKALSESTRCGVRRPAVDEFDHPQQAPWKLHVETWAGLTAWTTARRFSGRWKSFLGLLFWWHHLHVLIILLSHLGEVELLGTCWAGQKLEETARSGVCVVPLCPPRGFSLFSSLVAAGDWVRKGSYHIAWSVPCGSSCTCSCAYGQGPALGPHTG